MKIWSLFSLVILSFSAFSQPCDIGGSTSLTFRSQFDFDEFRNLNPSCTTIEASVKIIGDDIIDLSALRNIREIQGSLTISSCESLTTLTGLENLHFINSNLTIKDCESLLDISAINSLEHAVNFELDNLSALSNLGDFGNLDSIQIMRINELNQISFDSFSNLKYAKNIIITQNNFETLYGFPTLNFVENYIEISNNANLEIIEGFAGLKIINDELGIEKNAELKSIAGFNALEELGHLNLSDCLKLDDIASGFNSLDSVWFLQLHQIGLQDLEGFENLKKMGPCYIYNNPELLNLYGLSGLEEMSGELHIWFNEKLNSLEGIPHDIDLSNMEASRMGSPGWYFEEVIAIYNNASLELCNFEYICEILKVPGRKVIEENGTNCSEFEDLYYQQCQNHRCYSDNLYIRSQEEIDSFRVRNPFCESIVGNLIIGDTTGSTIDTILDFSSLPRMNSVSGDIIIRNSGLVKIIGEGPIGLSEIGGSLIIEGNDRLAEVEFLNRLKVVGGIHVHNNEKLSTYSGTIGLEYIERDISFINNPVLVLENVFEEVKIIGGDMTIESNAEVSFRFDSLQFMGGDLIYRNNGSTSLSIVRRNSNRNIPIIGSLILENNPNLRSLSIGVDTLDGDLSIRNNPVLGSILGEDIYLITGSVDLINNDQLQRFYTTSPTVSSVLMTIGGDLTIQDNEVLYDLSSLGTLRTLHGNFNISNNISLEHLRDFRFVSHEHPQSVTLDNNPAMSNCNIKLVCGQLTENNSMVRISSNQGGCSDKSTLELSCDSGFCFVEDYNINSQTELEEFIEANELCSIVQGDLDITLSSAATDTLSLLGLENIIGITGRLFIGNHVTSLTGLDNLSFIEGDFIPSPDLGSMEGLGNLESIGGVFNLDNVTMESCVGLQSLREVGELKLWRNSDLLTFEGLESLQFVDSDLSLSKSSIESLKGLEGLESVSGTFELDETNISSLNSLEVLSEVGQLNVQVNNNLLSLEGLESLKSVKKTLRIYNSNLESLQGLENLEYVGERIQIERNYSLTDIFAIKNILPDSLSSLSFADNEDLSICDIRLVCEFIELNPNEAIINNNAAGCMSQDELECEKFYLAGEVFYDSNENGIKDLEEFGLPNVTLSAGLKSLITNIDGEVQIFLEEGESYEIILNEDPDWMLTTVNRVYSGQFDSANRAFIQFGLLPEFVRHSAELNVTSNNIRCSETGIFYLNIQNSGTFDESGEVHFNFDPDMTFINSSLSPASVDDELGVIIWTYDNLESFERFDLELEFSMPDFQRAGDILEFDLQFYHLDNSELELLNGDHYESVLRCSYDPNDKQISPVGRSQEAYILRDEPVTYTLRFQNTGNDYARDIRLVDSIPEYFDLNTFRLVNSSHPVYTEFEDHTVNFFFDDIYLIDSLTNPDLSQGFVSFSMELKADTPDYTIVENNADIYFDFNPPIRTNTVVNTVVESYPTSTNEEEEILLSIYPNPFDEELYVSASEAGAIEIFDLAGRMVYKNRIEVVNRSQKVALKALAVGIYNVRFIDSSGIIHWKKIVKY